jgi:F-type H+-transporting ATPase subunit gamma
MTFEPDMDQLLPCEIDLKEKKENDSHVETLFEPDAETILNQLIPMMVTDVAYSDWMESTTAEQGSRRMAMKTATDNANDLVDELQLAYNKARQAAITQEITEIVGGSEAV